MRGLGEITKLKAQSRPIPVYHHSLQPEALSIAATRQKFQIQHLIAPAVETAGLHEGTFHAEIPGPASLDRQTLPVDQHVHPFWHTNRIPVFHLS